MPPKAKFTKEQITRIALDVVSKKGTQALTAKELGAAMERFEEYARKAAHIMPANDFNEFCYGCANSSRIFVINISVLSSEIGNLITRKVSVIPVHKNCQMLLYQQNQALPK